MSSHSVGRKVRNPEEAHRLLSRWRPSKQSLSEWCRFHGINVHSLAAHKKNLERADEKSFISNPEPGFFPRSPAGASPDETSGDGLGWLGVPDSCRLSVSYC
ncbi:MAG: hypothetical protein ACI8RZ_003098 [Myxococcota bacterium]|jgi:hypothetical protein